MFSEPLQEAGVAGPTSNWHQSLRLRLRALNERDQLLRIVRLLGAPEEVIDFEVLCRKPEEFWNRNLPVRLWISILIIAVLHSDPNRNATRISLNERVTILHLTRFVRQEVRTAKPNLQLFRHLINSFE